MKRILTLLVVLMACTSLTAGPILKGMLGYGILVSPSLPDISGFTGYEESSGGLSINAQILFGESPLNFGAEVGYLSLYSQKYESPAIPPFIAAYSFESSLSAIPILGIVQYTLGDPKGSLKPFLQGGLGFYMTSATATSLGISASSSELDLGIKLGVGMDYMLSDNLDLDISLNYYNIFVTGGASTLNLEAGVAFQL
ncbi:MAG: outer membrane beta-barrel protein [Spirochaetes bacterium]|nr:outer membrane beta-barrel protein [Spirochaetota bacterium]